MAHQRNRPTPAQERQFALEGAAEALEATIKRNQARIDELKSHAQTHQETVFVAFDTVDQIQQRTFLFDDAVNVLLDMDTATARQYLVRRQLRYEYEAEKLMQKQQTILDELAMIKADMQKI